MALLAERQETLPNLSVPALPNQLMSIVMQFACADRDSGHAGFAALEAQGAKITFAAPEPVSAELAFAIDGLDCLQQLKDLIYNRFLHASFPR